MDSKVKKKTSLTEIFKFISTIVSWTVFVLLLICAAFLIYYFIAVKVYVAKGSGYEPKFSLYTIITPSMTPNINVYDVVVDVKVDKPEDIKINDVITFYSSIPGVRNGTITHRVIAINKDVNGKYKYLTKGDYNLVDDGVDVEFDKIVGQVALRIPQLGRVQFFMASKLGWLLVVLLPALYIILKDILRIIRLKNDTPSNKFTKFLNRPVISFKKKKLLPYTPPSENENIEQNLAIEKNDETTSTYVSEFVATPNESEVSETTSQEVEIKNQDLKPLLSQNEEKENLLTESSIKSEENKIKEENVMSFYEDDEDDIDLPSLK